MHNVLRCAKKIIKPLVPTSVRRKLRRQQQKRIVSRVVRTRHENNTTQYQWGVSLIGDMHRGSGLGQASRANLQCLKYAGVPTQEVPMTDECLSGLESSYKVMLIHTNPDQLERICKMLPKRQWSGKYVIGEWVWEQEELPDWWLPYLELFDEIWAPSGFAAGAIQKATDKIVRVLPHAVEPQCDEEWDRNAFDLPENLFLCLITFDYHSVIARKNPGSAIKAFCQAFDDCREKVGLVIKARNTPPEILQHIQHTLKDWCNVFFLTEDYSKDQVNSLIHVVDVYVSLHRSEGFGLVLAEAMYLGTPVVATNWSGNTEFMNPEIACMVDASLEVLKKDELPFLKGSRWAEPDVGQAAQYLRRLYEEPEWREEIAERAKIYIRNHLSVQAVSEKMQEYLLDVREKCGI